MPDPIDELENFSIPGPPMTPMPAAEVRRRGTRIRRRNNALAAVGGLAVVAAIATPFAVFAGTSGSSHPQPADPVSWRQEIPADFTLSEGMFGEPAPKVTDSSQVIDLSLCGAAFWSPDDTVDVAGARFQGIEEQSGRTLALYADDAGASRALADIRAAVDDCPRDENESGAPLVHNPLDRSLGGDDSFTFIQRAKDGSLYFDLTLVEVVQSGNALYLDSSSGSAADDQSVAIAQTNMERRSAAVRGALCVFSAAGCGSDPDQAEDTADEAATSIPGDFDILAGLPPETDQRFGPQGPARDMEDIDLTACGQEAPFASTVDRMRLDFNQAVGQRQRQLMVFTDEDAAQSWLADASSAFVGCEEDGGNGVVGRYDVLGSGLGASGATVTLRHYVDGEPGLGYEITEFVRVGAAVLVARTAIDGSSTVVTDEVLTDHVATSQAEINPVVDAMCIFDPARC